MKTLLKKTKVKRYYLRHKVTKKYLSEFIFYHYDLTDKEFEKIFMFDRSIEKGFDFTSKNEFEHWIKTALSNARRGKYVYKSNVHYLTYEEFVDKVREYILNNIELVTCEVVKTYEAVEVTDSLWFINYIGGTNG